jgi:hypothetical protein
MDRHPTILERSPSHESDDRHVPRRPGGDCSGCGDGSAIPRKRERPVTNVGEEGTGNWESESGANGLPGGPPSAVPSTSNRGLTWVIGSFLFCPCHLPLTLGLAATLLAGTAAGALLRQHPVTAGIAITLVWSLGTARGLWLLRTRAR